MTKLTVVFAVALVLLSLTLAAVEARELVVEADEVAGIRASDESTDVRFLMRFEMPEKLEDQSVDFVCVSFDVNCDGDKGAVSLEAFRVTTAWDASSVGWSGPWERDGGDWDADVSAEWVVPEGVAKAVYLDVTDFVNRWLKDPSSNFGIIVNVSGPLSGAFSLSGPRVPQLRILY